MARNRFLCWLVVLLYVLVGGIQTLHALEPVDSPALAWTGPATPSVDCGGGCENPQHHHPQPKSHDHEHCALCHVGSLPAARLERTPRLVPVDRSWAPAFAHVSSASFRDLLISVAARAPPSQV